LGVWVQSIDDLCREFGILLTTYQTGLLEAAALYTCSQCNAPSIGLVYADSNHYRADLIMNNLDVEPRWIPEAGSGKDYPEVPPTIASTADEAHRCYSIKAYRGAIALARAALEATAKDKGYTKGGLQQKIKDMTDDRLLRSNIGEAADQLRNAGNGVLHADDFEEEDSGGPDNMDAENALWLLDEVLLEVYQSTARLALIKERAEAARERE